MEPAPNQTPLLIRLSDWFFPTPFDEGPEQMRRGRMLLAFHALGALNLLWTAFYQLAFGWKQFGLVALALLPILFLIPAAIKFGTPIRIVASIGVFIFFAVTVGLTLATAGEWPGGLYFLVLVPAVAVLLIDRRAGIRWGLVTLATIVFARWAAEAGAPLAPISIPPEELHKAQYRIASLLTLAILAMAYFYSSLNDRTITALNGALEKFQRGERRFRAIAEHAYDLISELDETGRVTYASPGFEEALGWIPDDVPGHNLFDRVHPDDLPRARMYWEELLEKSAVKQDAIRYESTNRGWRWLEISMRCYETTGMGRRVVAVVRDATERLEQEKLIRQQQNLVIAGTMATGIGHQLSNPINSILASAQYGNLFKWNPNFGDIAGESLDSIEDEAKNCGRILRSLRSFARQERSERWVESIDLVIRRAASAVETQDETVRDCIALVPCRETAPVLMGPIEIEQAFINLLRNALEAKATVVSATTELCDEQTVAITIRDNGRGMANDVRDRAFGSFYTTHPETGSGLGLTIAREIIIDHGGQLTLRETSSEGSVFRIELPLAESEAEA